MTNTGTPIISNLSSTHSITRLNYNRYLLLRPKTCIEILINSSSSSFSKGMERESSCLLHSTNVISVIVSQSTNSRTIVNLIT